MGKINLSALVIKSFSLQYERQAGKRLTLAIGYSMIPYSSIALKSFIKKQVDDPAVRIEDYKLGTFVVTPEVRYYLGKKGAFHGFYLAPYARFAHYKIQGPIQYYNTDNGTQDALFAGTMNIFTGGLMMGSSFQLSRILYLDWWILGGSFGGASGTFKATIPLSEADQVSLQSALDNLNVPLTSTTSEVNSNGATISTTGSIAGVRGFGLNLGIRF